MVIENRKTNGAQPVKVSLSSNAWHLVIHWNECDLKISAADIMAVIAEDDGK